MNKINVVLMSILLAFFLIAGISNFDSITLSGDLVVGDDATVTDDMSVGGDLELTGGLTLGSTVVGQDTFTTTAAADTVVITGTLATDYFFVTGVGASVDQQDVLQATAKADTLIVDRLAAGADGLVYNWVRIR